MRILGLALIAILTAAPIAAQTRPAPDQRTKEKTGEEERLHTDWAYMKRYQAENAALPPTTTATPRVVFLGDSITQMFRDFKPDFFVDGRIGRGIGGQTTPQMLVRFRQDVIDLHPAVVQIMAAPTTSPAIPAR